MADVDVVVAGVVLRWRYLHDGAGAVHALLTGSSEARCGLTPAWWRPERTWRGDAGDELVRAQSLPRCQRCERSVAKMVPPVPRPELTGELLEVYEWLRANGVDEWVPPGLLVRVEGTTLAYTAYVWSGPRGWDMSQVQAGLPVETRRVRLRRPVTGRVRQLARQQLLDLVEQS